MKWGLYPRLAVQSMRKNARLTLPFIMTCVGMVVMHYIVSYLTVSKVVENMRGGDTVQAFLSMGMGVIAFFSLLFLFYTDSFLIRRRKKEFGLYNILGMGKSNIAFILFWETLFTAIISVAAGLFIGIVLSKLAEMFLAHMLGGDPGFGMSVSYFAVIRTVIVFFAIFGLLFLNAFRQIRFSAAVDLIKSENAGEKPPKANFLFGILGMISLAAAYIIAVTVDNPLSAMALFFFAVLLVIGGTYLLMIAGSVMICRVLQKNKKFYYNPKHFVSVSSMAYRMKRNGAGLASICILATMVLVMTSSTVSLYFGTNDSVMQRYPREINMSLTIKKSAFTPEGEREADILRQDIGEYVEKNSAKRDNLLDYRFAYTAGVIDGSTVDVDMTGYGVGSELDYLSTLCEFYFVPLDDYNRLMGTNVELEDGEALIFSKFGYKPDVLSFNGGESYKVTKLEDFPMPGQAAADIYDSMAVIVRDVPKAVEGLERVANVVGDSMVEYLWLYCFDCGLEKEAQHPFAVGILDEDPTEKFDDIGIYLIESREQQRVFNLAINGGLFFLGILLSIVFLFAAVLIIYYKQLSEGYEDRSRFEIMQKVGMTDREIRTSVNSQLLTVFFLPLVLAGIHICFAFPIINMLLKILYTTANSTLSFLIATVLCYAVFAIFYVLVYKITSNAYYRIVSGTGGKK